MSRRSFAPISVLAGALALSGGLAGCAQMGSLGHPGSIFGHGSGAAAGGAANQARQEESPNHPTQTIDPRDQSATQAPARTLPIPGQAPDPFKVAPPGALPDPYANPPR